MQHNTTEQSVFIDAADVAKYIRKDLGANFPGMTFSVKTKKYSGGASIDIKWTDGPTSDEVKAIVDFYKGSGFDGMIDLKYSHYHWLMPDGTIAYHGTFGTHNNAGTDSEHWNPKPHPQAKRCHMMADFIFYERKYTYEFLRKATADLDVSPEQIIDDSYFGARLKIDDYNEERRVMWKVQETSAYTKPVETPKTEMPTTTDAPATTTPPTLTGYIISYERDWTWVKFAVKPGQNVIDWLKEKGAKWSMKRAAWYFDHKVTAEELAV